MVGITEGNSVTRTLTILSVRSRHDGNMWMEKWRKGNIDQCLDAAGEGGGIEIDSMKRVSLEAVFRMLWSRR